MLANVGVDGYDVFKKMAPTEWKPCEASQGPEHTGRPPQKKEALDSNGKVHLVPFPAPKRKMRENVRANTGKIQVAAKCCQS